jgi:hypothetical protein
MRRLAAPFSTDTAPRSATSPRRSPGRFTCRVSYDDLAAARDAVGAAIGAGFTHIVFGLRTPYPDGVARWVADEIVTPSQR